MKNYKTLLLSASLLCIANSAYAADEATSPSPELVIGSIMPSSVGASASASAYGFTVNAAYDFEFKNGLFAGIAYPDYTAEGGARELLIGYGSLSYDKIKGTVTVTDGSSSASVSGSAAVKGDVKALAAIYSWKTGHDGLYAGGGLAVSQLSLMKLRALEATLAFLEKRLAWFLSEPCKLGIGCQAAVTTQ